MRDLLAVWRRQVGQTNRALITNITIAANTTGVNTGNTLIITSS